MLITTFYAYAKSDLECFVNHKVRSIMHGCLIMYHIMCNFNEVISINNATTSIIQMCNCKTFITSVHYDQVTLIHFHACTYVIHKYH